jgi:hypothetical protein
MSEDVFSVFGFAQYPGVDVGDEGGLAEIEADHLGDIGVNRFVVGHAGADGIGDGDVAGAIGGEQAGDAEHGVGAKHEGIQEVVVDAAVNHVDALRPLRGAREYCLVTDEEVLTFHELYTIC